ncbi:ArsR/SmtB family transcription factor [Bacillus horti]|nr:metalloregulator ArsR/SmtB family transcription factor [Bacillus horti]
MTLENQAAVLKLLGDKTRLSMIGLLEHQECCVCEFVEIFSMSQPAISQHLRKLKDAGLVNESRKGQWIYYSLNRDSAYFPMVDDVLKHIPSQQEKLKWLEEQGLKISCD